MLKGQLIEQSLLVQCKQNVVVQQLLFNDRAQMVVTRHGHGLFHQRSKIRLLNHGEERFRPPGACCGPPASGPAKRFGAWPFASVKFTAEWLELSQDRRLITDDPNVMGKPNYPGCIRHRTQTVLTLLYIKYGFMNYNYPVFSQYLPAYDCYKNSPVSDLNFFILTVMLRQPNTNILERAARKVLLNPFLTRAVIRTSSIIHRIDEQRKTDVNAHINRDRMIRRDIRKYLDFANKIHAFLRNLYAATVVPVKRRLLNPGKTNTQS